MSITPTPIRPASEFIVQVQELFEKAVYLQDKLGVTHYVNVDTMKIANKVVPRDTLGRFTWSRTENKELAQWCNENIGWDPLEDTHTTPGLFRDGSNERMMQIIQALWNKVETLENENQDLRCEVRSMSRTMSNRDD